jgi:hypothetical protein
VSALPEASDGVKVSRRSWPLEEKRRIVEEAFRPGMSVADVARRHGLNSNQVFNWRKVFGTRPAAEISEASSSASLARSAASPAGTSDGFLSIGAIAETKDEGCVGGFAASAVSDHWSRKTVMQIGIAGTTLFTLLIPLVQNAEQLISLRLLTGLAGGFAVSAPFPIAIELMPAQHRRTFGAIYEMALASAFHPATIHRFSAPTTPTAFDCWHCRVGWPFSSCRCSSTS